MHKRLYIFIKKVQHEYQFGFQEGKSTEYVTLDLYTNMIQSIAITNNKNPAAYF